MASLFLLATCLSVGLRASAFEDVGDSSALVQSRIARARVQATSRVSPSEVEVEAGTELEHQYEYAYQNQTESAANEAVVFKVMAKLTTNQNGPCRKCWETGVALRCRGKTLKFTFKPSTKMARVVNKFPMQNIGFTPAQATYHLMTITLRSNNVHTYMIADGATENEWSKDFRRYKMFPKNAAQLANCKVHTFKKSKKLADVGMSGKQCDSKTKRGLQQEHCYYLPEAPARSTLPGPYTGDFPAPPPPSHLCYGKGDPHYKPYLGSKFNFQGNGTYILSRIDSGPFSHVLQAFNCPVKESMKNGVPFQKFVSQAVAVAFLLDGHKFQFYQGETKVDGGQPEPYGCRLPVGDTNLKMDVSDSGLIVDGPTSSGMYVEIKVNMREGISTSRTGYVLDVYSTVPLAAFNEEPAVTGLCAGKNTKCEGTFLATDSPSNLFLESDATAMDSLCCPEDGCASPCVNGEAPDPTLEEICAAAEPADGRKVTVEEALLACAECGDDAASVEACAMDYCENPDDGEAIVIEACDVPEEENPEEEVTPPTDPEGVADPHCLNVLGEAFDVNAVGHLDFLKVPRMGPQSQRGQDLRAQVLIEPITRAHPCAPTVIKQLELSGRWLQLQGEAPLIISPGANGKPALTEVWASQLNPPRNPRRNSSQPTLRTWEWRNHTTLSLSLRGLEIQVFQRVGTKSRVDYLDVKFHGLGKLGQQAGGLLGVDSHTSVEKPLPECRHKDPKAPRVVLQEGGEDLDFEEGPGLLSKALATDSEFDLPDEAEAQAEVQTDDDDDEQK